MESIVIAFTSIFLPIFLGMISRTGNFIPAKSRPVLQQFAVRVTIPALIFSSLRTLDGKSAGQFLPMALGLLQFTGMTWILMLSIILLLRKKISWVQKYSAELLLVTFSGNVGYICWILQDIIIGKEGLQRGIFYTSLFWPFLLFFSFLTVLILGLTKTKALDKKQFLYNLVPILSSLFLGLTVGIFRVETPDWLNLFTENFGSIAIPLILFCMGLTISLKSSAKNAVPLIPFLIIRLGVWLFATFIMLKMPWYDDISKKVLMINAFAPLAVNTLIISDMFGLDTEFIANSAIISTVLYLISIPFLFMFWI